MLVIGCGWAGVLLSYFQSRRGLRVICIDKSSPGGLLRSVSVNGFVIDIGGSHIIFSKNPSILNTMLDFLNGDAVHHYRKAFITLEHGLVPYPLENNLSYLPLDERYEALVDFLEALYSRDVEWRPGNLHEWIRGVFGKWIAEKYLIPYNRKIWKRPLDKIDVDWIGLPGRLPMPDWRSVVRSSLGIPTEGFIEQSRFYYPTRNGIYTLFKSVLEKTLSLNTVFMTDHRVEEINLDDSSFIVNGRIRARVVYSTIPIVELLDILDERILEHTSISLSEVRDVFDYNKVVVVAVALKKRAPSQHWVYVPDERIVFHRYAWISNYSPFNAPGDHSTLIAEITIPRGSTIEPDIEYDVLNDLVKLEVMRDDEVLFHRKWVHEYGYPIHTIGLSQRRSLLLRELREVGIVSVGRWGGWRYLNMDMVLDEVLNYLNTCGRDGLHGC